MNKQERSKFWLDIGTKIDAITSDVTRLTRFEEQLSKFYRMIGEHYRELLEAAEKAAADPELRDLARKPKGRDWEIEYFYELSSNGKLVALQDLAVDHPHWQRFWRKKLPPDPRNWWPFPTLSQYEILLSAKRQCKPALEWHPQRPPDKDEKLMLDYVLLATIHDGSLRDAGAIQTYLCFDSPEPLDKWFEEQWRELRDWDENTEYSEGDAGRAKVTCALGRIKADLGVTYMEVGKPAKMEQNGKDGQSKDDLITLTVAVTKFQVSKTTLRRAISDERLKNYGKKSLSMVSESKVANLWPRR